MSFVELYEHMDAKSTLDSFDEGLRKIAASIFDSAHLLWRAVSGPMDSRRPATSRACGSRKRAAHGTPA